MFQASITSCYQVISKFAVFAASSVRAKPLSDGHVALLVTCMFELPHVFSAVRRKGVDEGGL